MATPPRSVKYADYLCQFLDSASAIPSLRFEPARQACSHVELLANPRAGAKEGLRKAFAWARAYDLVTRTDTPSAPPADIMRPGAMFEHANHLYMVGETGLITNLPLTRPPSFARVTVVPNRFGSLEQSLEPLRHSAPLVIASQFVPELRMVNEGLDIVISVIDLFRPEGTWLERLGKVLRELLDLAPLAVSWPIAALYVATRIYADLAGRPAIGPRTATKWEPFSDS